MAKKSPWHVTDPALHQRSDSAHPFSDVPITNAIENLASRVMPTTCSTTRWAAWAFPEWAQGQSQLINLRLEHVTAWNTLNRMLNAYGLGAGDNPVTQVWVRPGCENRRKRLDVSLRVWTRTVRQRSPSGSSRDPVFRRALWDALENLIRQAELPMMLDAVQDATIR